ncbi:hypothetical protein ACFL1H_05530 [Nanoarchaeota archaeon]
MKLRIISMLLGILMIISIVGCSGGPIGPGPANYEDCGTLTMDDMGEQYNECMNDAMLACNPAKMTSEVNLFGIYMKMSAFVEGKVGSECEVRMVMDKVSVDLPPDVPLDDEAKKAMAAIEGMSGKEMRCRAPIGTVGDFEIDDEESCSGSLIDYNKQLESEFGSGLLS